MSKVLGQRLKELREEFGYTRHRLAKSLHQTEQSIYFYETGRNSITYVVAYVISHEFGINKEYLLDENATKKYLSYDYSEGFNDGYRKGLQSIKNFIEEVR